MNVATAHSIEDSVSAAVDAWLRWVPRWAPASHRSRARLCRKCTGSPLAAAAGLTNGVPHQVTHALVIRMHRIIDEAVDRYTAQQLPLLHSELAHEELWNSGGYDPLEGLGPEFDGIDPDPEPDEEEQPFLFTMAEFAVESEPDEQLPRPPLTDDEKAQLRREIELADGCANETGRRVCAALAAHRPRVTAALARFVEPQVQALLDELTQHLDPPQ